MTLKSSIKRFLDKGKGELSMRKYLINVLVAIDQLGNAITGGDPDETWSSRFGKYQEKVEVYGWICAFLEIFDPGHCEKAIEEDEGDDQVAPYSRPGVNETDEKEE